MDPATLTASALAALLLAGCSTPHNYPPSAPNTGRRKPPPEQD